ncbi:poly(A)-specific ribonuclease PARN-like [Cylas formicarius]|uniref:poly(A)-specific ribonuclease PARN-like n=1 Tax=Cylas formicarius TaxID=197179 RepID=UPI0029588902|nr:poly(A)-specific ribonuclease PARN-like [Cylas formicarius]
MEVTQSNFEQLLPEIEKAINGCSFLSVDCELTGLKVALNNINAFDSPEQYYKKITRDCKEFLVIQYGITLFRYEKGENRFRHQSFNFYVFRRNLHKYVPDQRFLCQTSSIDFLIANGFDFNKLFKDGISYLNDTEENASKKLLTEQHEKRLAFINTNVDENNDNIPIPESAQVFLDDVVRKLEDFLDGKDTELYLPKCNAFLRKLVYQVNREKFRDKISLETKEVEKERVLCATRIKTTEERGKDEKRNFSDSLNELNRYLGFSKVIRLIVKSGKLVIGHNFLLDFLHTIEKFLTPLPEDYNDFKECAGSMFSRILDTKFMSSSAPFKSQISTTILGSLLGILTEAPFGLPKTEVESGKVGYSTDNPKEHEAGYDSFITGLCFLAMWQHLGFVRNWSDEDIFGELGFALLKPYLNKIFLMFLTDNQYLHVAGHDLNPSREHVFYLTFPKEWKTDNIAQLFSPFGSVQVAWLSETSAYVGLFKKEHAPFVLQTLSKGDVFTITTFARRQSQLAGIKIPCLSPLKTRKSSEPPGACRKRCKTDNSGGVIPKRSFEPIEEEMDESVSETENETIQSSSSEDANESDEPAVKKRKTFAECDSWD